MPLEWGWTETRCCCAHVLYVLNSTMQIHFDAQVDRIYNLR